MEATFLFHISDLISIPNLWTWGAVVLAAVAAFGSLLRRSRSVFSRLRSVHSVLADSAFFDDSSFSSLSSSPSSDEASSSSDEAVDLPEKVDDGWRWTRSDVWLEELVGGGDVVRSWEEEKGVGVGVGVGLRKEKFGWDQDEVVRSFGGGVRRRGVLEFGDVEIEGLW